MLLQSAAPSFSTQRSLEARAGPPWGRNKSSMETFSSQSTASRCTGSGLPTALPGYEPANNRALPCRSAARMLLTGVGRVMVVVSRGRAPLKTVASKLLGPAGSVVQVVFRRGPKTITLQCQRSVPDIKAAQLVRASDVLLLVGELRDAREALVGPVCLHKQTAPLTQCACSGRCCRRLHVLKENATT